VDFWVVTPVFWSEKSCKQRFGVLPVGEASWSRRRASSLLGQAFRSERRVGVGSDGSEHRSSLARPSGRRGRLESEASTCSSLVRPSGRRLDRPSGLSFRYFGPAQELRFVRNIVCWAELLLGSKSMRDPGFMNPTLWLSDKQLKHLPSK